MTLRLVTLTLVLACFAIPAMAQDYSKAEVFGAFSVMHIKADNGNFKETPLGWQASVAANVNKTVGLVADFGGQYKTITEGTASDKFKVYEYLFGPRFNARMNKTTVFAHALFGGVHHSEFSESSNDFAMGYGGGLDVKASDKVSIRVIQFDWIPIRDNGDWIKNITRYGFGVVFRTGE